MFDFNGENLQVGDKVIVYASYFSSKSYYVGTVVKRTPTGLLDIEYGDGKKKRDLRVTDMSIIDPLDMVEPHFI